MSSLDRSKRPSEMDLKETQAALKDVDQLRDQLKGRMDYLVDPKRTQEKLQDFLDWELDTNKDDDVGALWANDFVRANGDEILKYLEDHSTDPDNIALVERMRKNYDQLCIYKPFKDVAEEAVDEFITKAEEIIKEAALKAEEMIQQAALDESRAQQERFDTDPRKSLLKDFIYQLDNEIDPTHTDLRVAAIWANSSVQNDGSKILQCLEAYSEVPDAIALVKEMKEHYDTLCKQQEGETFTGITDGTVDEFITKALKIVGMKVEQAS